MPAWFEWILAIVSLLANIMVISGIVVYLLNRPKNKRFPLTDIFLGELEPLPQNGIVRRQKIRLCFYNKTNSQFYISRINIYRMGDMDHVNSFKNENVIMEKENFSSVYCRENEREDCVINVCVQPHSPCVINGCLYLDSDEQLPTRITLVVVTATQQIFKYNIETEAQVVL